MDRGSAGPFFRQSAKTDRTPDYLVITLGEFEE